MSSYPTLYKSPIPREIERKAYARVAHRATAFLVVFLVAISAAVFGDRLGFSLEFVTYAVVVLVVLVLGAAPAVSKFFEWKRVITAVAMRQQHQLRAISVAWAQYAERLSELESQRAQIVHQTNRAKLAELMTARSRVKPNIASVKPDAMFMGGIYREQEVVKVKATGVVMAAKHVSGDATVFYKDPETGSLRFRGAK